MLNTRICVSIPPKTIDEAFLLIQKAEAQHADLIEVRLDNLKNRERIIEIPSFSQIPLIATNKSIRQNGRFSGTEKERQKILLDAAKAGFAYVDVDMGISPKNELIRSLKDAGVKVIVSFHDFELTPSLVSLSTVLEEQLILGANVCKIITTARMLEDNLTTLNFISDASKHTQLVCFAMGDLGKPSRLLSPVFGAIFTFACLDEKRKTAKGQLTIQEMKLTYKTLGLK